MKKERKEYIEKEESDNNQEMDYEYPEENKIKTQKKRQKRNSKGKQTNNMELSSEEVLLRILSRLDKLEIQQRSRFANFGFADRS